MNKKNECDKILQNIPSMDLEGFDQLVELAINLRWSWNHATDNIWRAIDAELWESTHNPWVMLQTVSRDTIKCVLTNPVHRKNIDDLIALKRKICDEPKWFQQTYKDSPLKCIAYFCMEFMLSEALPIYSGGLGNVAGDQLKAASDLGVPVIGIGLLYQQGYFHQVIDKDGAQQAFFPCNDSWQLPVTPLRSANGEWLRIKLDLACLPIWLRVWEVQVGRAKLYLLDSNDASNYAPYRGITAELYGGGPRKRLMQELILGMGGWKLLSQLGVEPEVCHLNEGHAAFAVLERARSFMKKNGQSFETALAVTRAGNLFTTHTAVKAGFDLFEPELINQYLGDYAEKELGITRHDFFAMGRQDPNNNSEKFNMAYLAIRGCGSINGVSRLHAKVSQHLFASLFPRWPIDEVPVKHVTNGIHTPSWDSPASDDLLTKACGKSCWTSNMENLEENIRKISDQDMWQLRKDSRKNLVEFVRKRLPFEHAISGLSQSEIEITKHLFDPNTLTLGFARRFATYKRPDLLLHNKERLLSILSNPQRPVQLIMAGKAHPADLPGQALIKEWIHFIRTPEARPHIIFLSDDDMLLTEKLVQGVDVWINTPRRPWEACGTSGMKVLVNGGINLSELDGWWAEAYTPQVGWALGDGEEHGNSPTWDAKEADDLYTLLESKVIPEFYTRNKEDIPSAWVARMRESMARLTPQFSAHRAEQEYVKEHYLPAAKNYSARAANKGAIGMQMMHWHQELKQKWGNLGFGELKIKTNDKQHVFEIPIYCNDLDPLYICPELYANAINKSPSVRIAMTRLQQMRDVKGCYIYSATVAAIREVNDYTVRIIPNASFRGSTAESTQHETDIYTGACVPLEAANILWQR